MRIGGLTSKPIMIDGVTYCRYNDFRYFQDRADNLEALLKYCFPFEDEWKSINKRLCDENQNFEITKDSLNDIFAQTENIPLHSRIWYEQELESLNNQILKLKNDKKRLIKTLESLKKHISKALDTTEKGEHYGKERDSRKERADL